MLFLQPSTWHSSGFINIAAIFYTFSFKATHLSMAGASAFIFCKHILKLFQMHFMSCTPPTSQIANLNLLLKLWL